MCSLLKVRFSRSVIAVAAQLVTDATWAVSSCFVHQVRYSSLVNCPPLRLIREDGESYDSARVDVDDDRDPPAEGPALPECAGDPRHPAASHRRDQGEIDFPDLICAVGAHGLALRFGPRFRLSLGRAFVGTLIHGLVNARRLARVDSGRLPLRRSGSLEQT
ncbi:MAG: hypothetical protein HY791_24240 [Deltaproteobacteria bacterium]|nr:hypothetical protein [Deltaproteobacteria bacterium]